LIAMRTPREKSVPEDGDEIHEKNAMSRRHEREIENLGGWPQFVVGLHNVASMSNPFAPSVTELPARKNGVGRDEPSAENPRHDPLVQRHFGGDLFPAGAADEFVQSAIPNGVGRSHEEKSYRTDAQRSRDVPRRLRISLLHQVLREYVTGREESRRRKRGRHDRSFVQFAKVEFPPVGDEPPQHFNAGRQGRHFRTEERAEGER